MLFRPSSLLLFVSLTACDDLGRGSLDGGTDAAPGVCRRSLVDASFDGNRDADMDAAPVPSCVGCGNARPLLGGTGGTEALVIAADGTIYFSQPNGVGRMLADGTLNNTWAAVPGGTSGAGVVLDVSLHRLYATSPAMGAIYLLDLSSDPPSALLFYTTGGRPGPLALGDRSLFYGDTSTGHVWRLGYDGSHVRVTESPVAGVGGLAFLDGDLLVDGSAGVLWRLSIGADGAELSRTRVAPELGGPAGMTFDAAGFIYVADRPGGRVLRMTQDGSLIEEILTGLVRPTAVEFGAGALSCSDLYVATGNGLVRFEMGTAAGRDVPWHH